MKIKDGFILRDIASQTMVVAIGQQSVNFNGLIKLNSTGKYLWEKLQSDMDRDELVKAMTTDYDIDKATAEKDIDAFIETLRGADLLA